MALKSQQEVVSILQSLLHDCRVHELSHLVQGFQFVTGQSWKAYQPHYGKMKTFVSRYPDSFVLSNNSAGSPQISLNRALQGHVQSMQGWESLEEANRRAQAMTAGGAPGQRKPRETVVPDLVPVQVAPSSSPAELIARMRSEGYLSQEFEDWFNSSEKYPVPWEREQDLLMLMLSVLPTGQPVAPASVTAMLPWARCFKGIFGPIFQYAERFPTLFETSDQPAKSGNTSKMIRSRTAIQRVEDLPRPSDGEGNDPGLIIGHNGRRELDLKREKDRPPPRGEDEVISILESLLYDGLPRPVARVLQAFLCIDGNSNWEVYKVHFGPFRSFLERNLEKFVVNEDAPSMWSVALQPGIEAQAFEGWWDFDQGCASNNIAEVGQPGMMDPEGNAPAPMSEQQCVEYFQRLLSDRGNHQVSTVVQGFNWITGFVWREHFEKHFGKAKEFMAKYPNSFDLLECPGGQQSLQVRLHQFAPDQEPIPGLERLSEGVARMQKEQNSDRPRAECEEFQLHPTWMTWSKLPQVQKHPVPWEIEMSIINLVIRRLAAREDPQKAYARLMLPQYLAVDYPSFCSRYPTVFRVAHIPGGVEVSLINPGQPAVHSPQQFGNLQPINNVKPGARAAAAAKGKGGFKGMPPASGQLSLSWRAPGKGGAQPPMGIPVPLPGKGGPAKGQMVGQHAYGMTPQPVRPPVPPPSNSHYWNAPDAKRPRPAAPAPLTPLQGGRGGQPPSVIPPPRGPSAAGAAPLKPTPTIPVPQGFGRGAPAAGVTAPKSAPPAPGALPAGVPSSLFRPEDGRVVAAGLVRQGTKFSEVGAAFVADVVRQLIPDNPLAQARVASAWQEHLQKYG